MGGLILIGVYAAALLLSPTASQTVVVLPDPQGRVGAVVVQRDGEQTVLDTAYSSSRIGTDGAEQRAKMSPAAVKQEFGTALGALPARPVSFNLYFLTGKDELTEPSKVELDKAMTELKRRPVPDIVVIGHTDTVGGLEWNDKLSLARAERVREALIAQGLPAARIRAAGRGERELLVRTADDVAEPRNRRVEVNVR
ncbi:MAG: OmpA family protein [Burkholderiales bacterium]|nr:OmpA family protein [Burkholderiales bacterium]